MVELLGFEPRNTHTVTNPSAQQRWRRAGKDLAQVTLFCLMLVAPLITGITATAYASTSYWDNLPYKIVDEALPQPSVILDAKGKKLASFFSENREVVSYKQIPRRVRDAVVAIEDRRFYQHGALDVRGTLRALVNNQLGRSTQGGSTISQQYAKNLLLAGATTDKERAAITSQTSYVRKIRELRYAAELERTQTKNEILAGYLNAAYFGDGAYGIAAAAKHYFSKDLNELTVAESALLAGLVQNPTSMAPTVNPDAAIARRDLVLNVMAQLKYITRAEATTAKSEPLKLDLSSPKNGCTDSKYPYFCQYVRNVLANNPTFGATPEERQAFLYKGGMTIHTTLDRSKQKAAEAAVDAALGRTNRVAAAVAIITPGTGHITALAQNRDFGPDPAKNETEIILASRDYQPGSSFKPITLAAAVDSGYDLSTVENVPSRLFPPGMSAPDGGFRNSTAGAAGRLTAAQGLWRSSNTFYVLLESKIGVFTVRDMAEKLGYGPINNLAAGDASFTLGVKETSPIRLANVYATLAAHGRRCNPVAITSITRHDKAIAIPEPHCEQVVRPGVADTVANVMKGVIDGPDKLRTGRNQSLGRPAAGKTGTTENNGAVWFVGFTPQNSTAVWVGDPRGPAYTLQNFWANGRYIGRGYGGVVAGPIWKSIMTTIHQGLPVKTFSAADPSVTSGYVQQMPDVRGLSRAAATAALERSGLSVKIDTAPAKAPIRAGAVTGSNPEPGGRLPGNKTVTITIAK